MRAKTKVRIGFVTAVIAITLHSLGFCLLLIGLVTGLPKAGGGIRGLPSFLFVFVGITFLFICTLLVYAVNLRNKRLVSARRIYRVWLVIFFIVFGFLLIPVILSVVVPELRSDLFATLGGFGITNGILASIVAGLGTGIQGLTELVKAEKKARLEEQLRQKAANIMSQKTERCENCERLIPNSEQAYVYKGHIVCRQCEELLRGKD